MYKMKIIPIEILEETTITLKQMEYFKKASVMLEHKLLTLKQIFYELLQINVPADIMFLHNDEIKINLSHLILFFMKQTWKGQSINLQDKFFKCSICNQWAYFESYDKQVCIFCWKKGNSNFRHPAIIKINHQEGFKWK
jgi:hypothetical protein